MGDPFAQWPPANLPDEHPSNPGVFFQTVQTVSSGQPAGDEVSYAPSMVIGVGETGRLVLQTLIQQISINQRSNTSQLRIVLFHHDRGTQLVDEKHKVHTKNFYLNGDSLAQRRVQGTRQFYTACFTQAAVYRDVETYFQESVNHIHSGIRVYLIASLREPINAVCGSILQLLRQIQAQRACFSFTMGLLSLNAPEQGALLSDGEVYAAVREFGRFTFRDTHMFSQSTGTSSGIIHDQTLIDHLFLVDTRHTNDLDAASSTFVDSAGQMLSEALYTLLHPSGEEIHQRMANILTTTSNLRKQVDEPLVNSFSVATLRVPVAELQSFVEVRLAQAVLFGDDDAAQKGSVSFRGSQEAANSLVFDILHHKTHDHPVFSWMMGVRAESDLAQIPSIQRIDPYLQLFQWLVVDSANRWLEKNHDIKTLGLAAAILINQLRTARQVGGRMHHPDQQLAAWNRLRRLMDQMSMFLEGLQKQCQDWIEAFTGETWQFDEHSAPGVEGRAVPRRVLNPFDALTPITESKPVADFIFRKELSRLHDAAVDNLKRIIQGKYSAPVFQIRDDGQADLDNFYRGMIPEGQDSAPFDAISRRLGWWLRLGSETGADLLAIYLPDSWKMGDDRRAASFSAARAGEFFEAVREEAARQSEIVRARLTSAWFNDRVRQESSFLGRAARLPYLQYNEDDPAALSLQQRSDSRLAFIIGQDLPQSHTYLPLAFPNLASEQRRGLANGEKTRLTAFAINSYIPLHTVKWLGDFRYSYRREAVAHLYPAERNGRQMERVLRDYQDLQSYDSAKLSQIELLPPICVTLWQPSLSRLFFHALACGLIDIGVSRSASFGLDARHWQALEFEGYLTYDLSNSRDGEGLWAAYRNFCLVFPASPQSVPENLCNVDNPFLPGNRHRYFNALAAECEKRLAQAETSAQIEKAKKTVRDAVKNAGASNHLIQQFGLLAEYEIFNLVEPIETFSEPLLR